MQHTLSIGLYETLMSRSYEASIKSVSMDYEHKMNGGTTMNFKLDQLVVPFEVNRVYCAGYAGRNQEKVREHIDELAKIGVPAPERTPTVYPVSKNLLTNQKQIFVQGKETSGEVEFVLFLKGNDIFVTVGSDQTDRELEKQRIDKSKQVCEKPVANEMWDYKTVKDHWDSLILRSWVTDERGKRIYQEGQVTALLPVPELIRVIEQETEHPLDGAVIYSGTVPALNGFEFVKIWDLELEDPILNRKLNHHYEVVVLDEEMKK